MGLDYVILSLHIDRTGLNGVELMGIQHLFDIAGKRDSQLRFAIQLAPYADDPIELERTIKMVEKLYASHRNYLQLDGKPLLFWFWSSALDGNRPMITALKEAANKARTGGKQAVKMWPNRGLGQKTPGGWSPPRPAPQCYIASRTFCTQEPLTT